MADSNEDLNSFASEHSFVILGQGSLTSDVNETLPSVNSNQYVSHSNSESEVLQEADPSHDSVPRSPSPSGIQSKLDRLIKENLLLKEALNHSNVAMKNQFDTLALWHEEVVKTHESHKQKFQETQDQILKLRNENMSLKKLIQQNMDKCAPNNQTSICDDKKGMVTSMKMDSVNGEQVSSDFIRIEELRLKNTELERKLHDMTVEKSELESQLERLIEENVQLKICDKPNYDKCTQCQGVMSSMTTKKSDEEGKSASEESLSPNISIIERVSESDKASLVATQMKEDFVFMRQRLDDGLKSLENVERMNELRIQNEEMCKMKDELENELKLCKADVEKLKEENDRFSNELKEKDGLLESKQKELEEARNSVKELESECEKIPALEVQLELYKKDFNEERAAREEAIAEKEKFLELVRSSARLQQIEEKRKLEQSSSGTKNQEEVESYPCPKCWTRFSKPEDVQEHVYDCLNLDFS